MPRSLLLAFLLTLPGCVFEHGDRVYAVEGQRVAGSSNKWRVKAGNFR